jgi:hypothetical protein
MYNHRFSLAYMSLNTCPNISSHLSSIHYRQYLSPRIDNAPQKIIGKILATAGPSALNDESDLDSNLNYPVIQDASCLSEAVYTNWVPY